MDVEELPNYNKKKLANFRLEYLPTRNLEGRTILMRHNGLQSSTTLKKTQAKKKEKSKHMLPPPIFTQKRRNSENFKEKLKVFKKNGKLPKY